MYKNLRGAGFDDEMEILGEAADVENPHSDILRMTVEFLKSYEKELESSQDMIS